MSLKKHRDSIAIVGMSGRFPKAKNVEEYWENLCAGKDGITRLSNHQGKSKSYVNARGVIDKVAFFDADFFGMNQKEAELTDPQHRVFLECCYEAIEDAGYSPKYYDGLIGVYGSVGPNRYYHHYIYPHEDYQDSLDDPIVRIGNDHDYLTTRVSYKLNFKGPSFTIQTACSSSLAAICIACNQLKTGECDIAVAGGSSVFIPQEDGYQYQVGMIFSPDGTCRPFDKNAQGTVPGSGAGVVVLKRLEDAIKDKDHIYSVIRGHGINNDGAEKLGFSAPSEKGQVDGIIATFEMAKINPETIGYVEAHGTGTILGDPIEVNALKKAFGRYTDKTEFCGIGSVKSNIGHLMETSGVAGLIKTALSLYHEKIPPTIHFESPNPHISFETSPFFPVKEIQEWKKGKHPRRALVNALGFGGTNAYLLLEEAPIIPENKESGEKLIILSAKTESALLAKISDLKKAIQKMGDTPLSDIAYTLQVGRTPFPYRVAFIASSIEDLELQLSNDSKRSPTSFKPILFLFPDLPKEWSVIDLSFYLLDPDFEKCMEECALEGQVITGLDFRTFLNNMNEQPEKLQKIAHLSITYSLCQLYKKWGISPDRLKGIGVGKLLTCDCTIREMFLLALESKLVEIEDIDLSIDHIPIEITPKSFIDQLELFKSLWLQGIDIHWPSLYYIKQPRRVSLPSYPFEKKRFWIDPATSTPLPSPTTLEETLSNVWKKTLGVSDFSLTDHFTDLGGDSLSALQIVSKVNESLGITLHPSSIQQYPTIEKLSKHIRELQKESKRDPFIILKEGDQSPSLFMIHQIDGLALSYSELVKSLHYPGKIIGLESQFEPKKTLEQAASLYIDTMKQLQPQGPYYVIGTSFGGLLAYEIAQQLKANGDQLFLTMIDIVNPEAYHCDDMVQGLSELFSGEKNLSTPSDKKEQVKLLTKMLGFDALPYSEQEKIFDLMAIHWEAFKSYHPKPYSDKILFFEGNALEHTTLHSTWAPLAEEIESHLISGNHLELMKAPHAHEIGQKIEKAIEVHRTVAYAKV
ncbi:MAG: hypothetical protein KDK76_02775 [Chlamydiia bacterium]|nr:hypothetical protein [Chlamydiia bacterium]